MRWEGEERVERGRETGRTVEFEEDEVEFWGREGKDESQRENMMDRMIVRGVNQS